MTAIDQHGELHRSRSPIGVDAFKGSPHRATRVQHVVDEHHRGAVNGKLDAADGTWHDRAQRDVVAVHTHIDVADGHAGRGFDGVQRSTEHVGQPRTTSLKPDERETRSATLTLKNLVGDSRNGTLDVVCRHHRGAHLDLLPYGPLGTHLTVALW